MDYWNDVRLEQNLYWSPFEVDEGTSPELPGKVRNLYKIIGNIFRSTLQCTSSATKIPTLPEIWIFCEGIYLDSRCFHRFFFFPDIYGNVPLSILKGLQQTLSCVWFQKSIDYYNLWCWNDPIFKVFEPSYLKFK